MYKVRINILEDCKKNLQKLIKYSSEIPKAAKDIKKAEKLIKLLEENYGV